VTPCYDEYRKVFILTRGKQSFYMDLNGNFDRSIGTIEWETPPSAIAIARPYLVAFRDKNSIIEIKSLLNAHTKQQNQTIQLY
jgi:hypothetical protein